MRITVLHRKKHTKSLEIIHADEIWIVGRITPQMRTSITLAELVNVPVFYNQVKLETKNRIEEE